MKKKTGLLIMAAICVAASGLSAQAQVNDPRKGQPIATPNLQPPTQPQLPYRFVESVKAPNGEQFANIASVALLPNGHLIVFNRNPAIQMTEYTADLKFVRAFNPNIAVNAHGLRTDRYGNIWAIDSYLNLVWKLNSKGEPLMMIGQRGEVGAWTEGKWNGMFNQPLDVAFDQDDNFYVVQGHAGTSEPVKCTYCATYSNTKPSVSPGSDPRILKFDKTGKFVASLDLSHAPTERYPYTHSVVVTPSGEVWVADRQDNKILVLDRSLKKLREIKQPMLVSGLFVDAKGVVWIAAGMDGLIAKLDQSGKIVEWIGKAGRSSDPGSHLIGEAHYMAVSPDEKTIFIADSVNAKVHVLKHN
jgi:DNA-binding beta-propeller fold protein YncE